MRRVVTPEQKAEGYVVFVNGVIVRRPFAGAVRRPDGNYEVYEPRSDSPPDSERDRIPIIDAR